MEKLTIMNTIVKFNQLVNFLRKNVKNKMITLLNLLLLINRLFRLIFRHLSNLYQMEEPIPFIYFA